MGDSTEEDPYAVSSDSDVEGPPEKIVIDGRTTSDLSSLKAALNQNKEVTKDETVLEELRKIQEASEISKIKQDFIEGKVMKEWESERKPVEEDVAVVTKEQYSIFKEMFEKLPEMVNQHQDDGSKEMEPIGVGKDNLQNILGTFESAPVDTEIKREKIILERSKDEMGRILDLFTNLSATSSKASDEVTKECAVCSKTVYQVDRIHANKRNYHAHCFGCSKCGKHLTPTNYKAHEGNLLCKVHHLELFDPETAKTMDPHTTEEDERVESDEEEEFVISSKPKPLADDVIRFEAGAKVDALPEIGTLKARKSDFEKSAKEAATVDSEKKTMLEMEISSGKVKTNLEKFMTGTATNVGDEDGDELEDSGITRDKRLQKEELKFEQVGDVMNMWESGEVQRANIMETSKDDLEEIRKGPSLKERFKPNLETDDSVSKQWHSTEIDTSNVADARRSFLEGSAYQSAPLEKSADELIEMEFKRIKEFKDQFEKGGEGDFQKEKTPIEIHAEVADIKSTFEKVGEESDMTPEQRAELKQKQIEEEFQIYKQARIAAAQRQAAEKGAGEMAASEVSAYVEDNESEGAEVYETIAARDLKHQFEHAAVDENEINEEKKKQLAEEFERLKRQKKEEEEAREKTPEQQEEVQKEQIQVAADHASKMTQKWEKIRVKREKSAERSMMPPKQAIWNARVAPSPRCNCCGQVVYMAEQFQCFSKVYHLKCFRCKHCGVHLRVENCQCSPEGDLFCETHYRRLFVVQSSFVFRPNQHFILTS